MIIEYINKKLMNIIFGYFIKNNNNNIYLQYIIIIKYIEILNVIKINNCYW